MPRASSLAAQLQAELGADVTLIEGAKGIFDVVADGELVFSKHTEGRFPDQDEILNLLRSR